MLKVKLLSEHAQLPLRATPGAAGYDLFSAIDVEVPPNDKKVISTDIAIALPEGVYGRIAPRSGLAAKYFIGVGAGVIDSDYRGAVGVVLFNHSSTPLIVKKGDRIAQLILEKYLAAPIVAVNSLDTTERGSGGFGSTDEKKETLPYLIGLTGKIGAGKSTAAEILKSKGFEELSFAHSLKRGCMEIFGLTEKQVFGTQSEKAAIDEFWEMSPRRILQDVGSLLRGLREDIFIKSIEKKIRDRPSTRFVISDVRYNNEAAMIRSLGGKIITISRPGFHEESPEAEHESEKQLIESDVEIVNSGTLEDLRCNFNFILGII